MRFSLSCTIDILKALKDQLDAVWRKVGTFLDVEHQTMNAINKDNAGKTGDCMLALVNMWCCHEAGTGDRPRTWQTVVEAVKDTGFEQLALKLAKEHGVTLPTEERSVRF